MPDGFDTMADPSHSTFAIAVSTFIMAISWIYNERQTDIYRDHLLLVGCCLCAAGALLAGYNIQFIMLSVLPATSLAAIMLSAVVEQCRRSSEGREQDLNCHEGCTT